jgi:hypothetical protein
MRDNRDAGVIFAIVIVLFLAITAIGALNGNWRW